MPQASLSRRCPPETAGRSSTRSRAAAGLAAAFFVVLWTAGTAADDAGQVAAFGNWTVHKSGQATAEGGHCVAVHQRYGTVRLHNSGLFVLLPETPRGYNYRIDSNAPSGMRLASATEQETASLDIAGAAFAALQTGQRFRMEILTYTKVLEVDMDLAGIAEAIAFLVRDPACRR